MGQNETVYNTDPGPNVSDIYKDPDPHILSQIKCFFIMIFFNTKKTLKNAFEAIYIKMLIFPKRLDSDQKILMKSF